VLEAMRAALSEAAPDAFDETVVEFREAVAK
jgi:hypothetical protein